MAQIYPQNYWPLGAPCMVCGRTVEAMTGGSGMLTCAQPCGHFLPVKQLGWPSDNSYIRRAIDELINGRKPSASPGTPDAATPAATNTASPEGNTTVTDHLSPNQRARAEALEIANKQLGSVLQIGAGPERRVTELLTQAERIRNYILNGDPGPAAAAETLAQMHHELYQAFRKKGFTEEQAERFMIRALETASR